MKIFKDNNGREWKISITVETIKRVRSLCGVNLLDAIKIEKDGVKADLIDQISNDPVLLVDIIYCICRPQAEEEKISDQQFGESMIGDTVDAATDALLEELINFFPEAKKKVLRLVLESARRLRRQASETVDNLISSGLLQKNLSQMENDVSASFTKLPGASE